ncbi:HRDC-like protein [Cantharellus anzutake]|uniref:HRDC-like protein n=1 Tax=Cantharellus anzutake TaxID=1750568 RepID=UPI001903E715|nr:HRDC-like protein [Cantharellus anzutake]KAF8317777.1 HRDC-like protein [Cantharellus anzutake]
MSSLHRRVQKDEEEDADVLKLGSEFNNAGCLLISEVKSLLELRATQPPDNQVYAKTVRYVNDFSKFGSRDTILALREIFKQQPDLTQFEVAQIANLCPADIEEARNCIPSLLKIEDDKLQALLDEVQALRKFQ